LINLVQKCAGAERQNGGCKGSPIISERLGMETCEGNLDWETGSEVVVNRRMPTWGWEEGVFEGLLGGYWNWNWFSVFFTADSEKFNTLGKTVYPTFRG